MDLFDVLFAKKLSGGGSPFPPVIKRVTGNPIEFSDGADAPLVKCVTQITGSQDLHGYDKPWVGGANINKMPPGEAKSTSSYGVTITSDGNGIYTFVGTCTQDFEVTFDCDEFTIPSVDNSAFYLFNTQSNANTVFVFYENSTVLDTWALAGINRVSTYTGMKGLSCNKYGMRLKNGVTYNLTIKPMLAVGTSYTEWTPYSNICPIVAYDESTISVGVDEGYASNDFSPANGVTKTIESDGVLLSADGSVTYQTASIGGVNDLIISPGTYMMSVNVLSVSNPNTFSALGLRKSSYSFVTPNISLNTVGNKSAIITTTESVYISMVLNGATAGVQNSIKIANFKCIKLAQQSTATYTNSIYQGNTDFVGGVMTTALKVVDMGDIPWGYNAQYNYFEANLYVLKKYANNVKPNMYCECYAVINSRYGSAMGGAANGVICPRTEQSYIQVKETAYTDATQFRNSVTGMKLVYELATPTTSSVTPTNLPIKSLSGYNHIESSTGDMTIDYITDAYQNFVDTTERAVPSTRKGGVKAFDIFKTLDEPKKPEASAEESEPEEKEIEEGAKK